MTFTHDTSKPCGKINHTYRNYSVVWCPHRQQYTLRSSMYLELTEDQGPLDYTTRAVALGPFDTPRDVIEIMLTWIEEDVTQAVE